MADSSDVLVTEAATEAIPPPAAMPAASALAGDHAGKISGVSAPAMPDAAARVSNPGNVGGSAAQHDELESAYSAAVTAAIKHAVDQRVGSTITVTVHADRSVSFATVVMPTSVPSSAQHFVAAPPRTWAATAAAVLPAQPSGPLSKPFSAPPSPPNDPTECATRHELGCRREKLNGRYRDALECIHDGSINYIIRSARRRVGGPRGKELAILAVGDMLHGVSSALQLPLVASGDVVCKSSLADAQQWLIDNGGTAIPVTVTERWDE